jgi:predicted transcriptional regulator of viral defense system
VSKRALYELRDRGELQVIARGLYRLREAALVDDDLLEIALRSPHATICLTSALARHGLSDAIPIALDAALPRGARAPKVVGPVHWHWFHAPSFEIGRVPLIVDGTTTIGLYSAERSLVDAFRMHGRVGSDVAVEALKRWLRGRGHHPAKLLDIARQLPRGAPELVRTLQVLQ